MLKSFIDRKKNEKDYTQPKDKFLKKSNLGSVHRDTKNYLYHNSNKEVSNINKQSQQSQQSQPQQQQLQQVPNIIKQQQVPNEVLDIDFKNNEFIYNLTGDIYDNFSYTLLQFSGTIDSLDISAINPDTGGPTSSVYLLKMNWESNISQVIDSTFLFTYDGVRESYQYAQLKFLSDGDIIVLSGYTQNITFKDTSENPVSINSVTDGNYFIARFNMDVSNGLVGGVKWIVPITAFSDQYVEFCIDPNDNIYIVGTYQNTVRLGYIGGPSMTSNLNNDMFLARMNSSGEVIWLRSSNKDDPNKSNGIIRGESITFNLSNSTDRITAIGQYSSTFKYSNSDQDYIYLENLSDISYLLWVAQFDLDGNIIWMRTVTASVENIPVLNSYIDGYQIIYDFSSTLYITGIYRGFYIFNPNNGIVGSELNTIYVASMDTEGTWLNSNQILIDLPLNETEWFPHLVYTDKLYASVYGLGDIIYDNTLITGNKNISLWVNALENGSWGAPFSIQANIPNPSINTISYFGRLLIIGTYIITLNNTNGYSKLL